MFYWEGTQFNPQQSVHKGLGRHESIHSCFNPHGRSSPNAPKPLDSALEKLIYFLWMVASPGSMLVITHHKFNVSSKRKPLASFHFFGKLIHRAHVFWRASPSRLSPLFDSQRENTRPLVIISVFQELAMCELQLQTVHMYFCSESL